MCAVELTTVVCPGEAVFTYGEEPLRLLFLPSLPSKCFHIQIKCHLHNDAGLLPGKLAVTSLHMTPVYPSLYHSADHTALQ